MLWCRGPESHLPMWQSNQVPIDKHTPAQNTETGGIRVCTTKAESSSTDMTDAPWQKGVQHNMKICLYNSRSSTVPVGHFNVFAFVLLFFSCSRLRLAIIRLGLFLCNNFTRQ